ncbi:uncharacterized protein [Paramisgurnus dabryanus]|uniref:uncharacterized protein isoform X3 n=1 Tax=Paramisgurnus dabryanus TaxID=90735 RepID=UPI0031F38408
MEDEDSTCLLDVLCDPDALHDFLHGTNELPSGDLLISSSSGEPSLFTDTPSPGSLLADDASSQDTPVSGCVDLSFLDEALLASPTISEGPDEDQKDPVVHAVEPQQKESEEICDILQQSLQEADITEHTLALEAELAQTAETFQLGLCDASLPLSAAQYLSKPMTVPSFVSVAKDTQIAVEPPQPSLLAVGPGCPSLKPTGTQLMSLLPGNVFPAPPLGTSFSLNSANGSSMIIQKTHTGHQMLASTIRTIAPAGVMLQKTLLPIQPKIPVNIQPRLIQISPKPAGQKPLTGLAFIPANTSQNVLLSTSVGSNKSIPPQAVNKPVSLHLVSQGGPIVIQPQRHVFLPSQTPATTAQSTSTPMCLLGTPSNQVSNKSKERDVVDSSQIVTVHAKQINFSPILPSPNGQLTLKQGTLLPGSQIQSTTPTVFQIPAQLAGTYGSQLQGQQGAVVQSPTVGNQMTLINNASILIPDMSTIPIVNGQLATPVHRVVRGGPEGKLTLTQTSVLHLPERTRADDGSVNELPQEVRSNPSGSVESSLQSSRETEPLQSSPDVSCSPEPILSLSPQLINQTQEQQFTEGKHNPLPHAQALIHLPQQNALKPSATHESLAEALLLKIENNISPAMGEAEDFLASFVGSDTFSSLSECEEMSVYPDSEHTDITLTSPVDQNSVMYGASIMGPTPSASEEQCLESCLSIASSTDLQRYEGAIMNKSPSFSSEKVFEAQQQRTLVFTNVSRTSESTAQVYNQPNREFAHELTINSYGAKDCSGIVCLDQHELQEMMGPRLHSQCTETSSTLQKLIQTPSVCVDEKEDRLTLEEKQHMVKQQLFLDHSSVLNPNTSAPFVSMEDAVRHLLPYHACARPIPGQTDLISVDKQFEWISALLLKQITDMLSKYRLLLLCEAQESPSAEMVMLERLFLQSERLSLGEDRRRARRDPVESFQESWHLSSPQNSMLSVQKGHSNRPPSPPSWPLQSDRPPGLKTYRSSSKGTLRLTIKHESGCRKIIHNSACDFSCTTSGHKRNYSGQLTNGQETQEKEESLKLPTSDVTQSKNDLTPDQLPEMKLHPDVETCRTDSDLQVLSNPLVRPEFTAESSLYSNQSSPVLKRNKVDASEADCPGLPAFMEDRGLSEHLQSAIDSILELQRLQGSASGVKLKTQQSRTMDQAVSSILKRQL